MFKQRPKANGAEKGLMLFIIRKVNCYMMRMVSRYGHIEIQTVHPLMVLRVYMQVMK